MGIRAITFCLFLYFALVWVVIALVYSHDDVSVIVRMGLIWTAVGLVVVLVWLIAHQVFTWVKYRKAHEPQKPVGEQQPQARTDSDQAAFAELIHEADTKLAGAVGGRHLRIKDLPIYLLVGSEGAGKTSILFRAGIDARLLAGQVSGQGSVSGTRVANIWLANDCVFIEVSGRLFQGESGKLREVLRVLLLRDQTRGWRRLWSQAAQRVEVKGAILCCDLRGFIGPLDRAVGEKFANSIRERLFTISEVFGIPCPVYAMFTRTDAIPFFSEFFDRMPESEATQPFGILTGSALPGKLEDGVWAETENKRLSRDFTSLFLFLNSRRLLSLSQEPLAEKKPAIYEFPREFKRLRSPIAQFLVDALRPDPLVLSPVLRGFFFCGVRQVAGGIEAPPETFAGLKADWGSGEATGIFRPESTQILSGQPSGQRRGEYVEKPLFTRDFFQIILRSDRPAISGLLRATDSRSKQKHVPLVIAGGALAVLLTLIWTVSWVRNRALINDVQQSFSASGNQTRKASESLRGLDELRHLLADRLDQPRPLSMNWGLYTGFQLQEDVRRAYFERLSQLLLKDANSFLLDDLRRLNRPENAEPYDRVYARLKTQVTISKSGCQVDAALVAETLNQVISESKREVDGPSKELMSRQIDYYVEALRKGNPVPLKTDTEAISRARDYLTNSRGPEQVYAAILETVRKDGSRVSVGEHVSNLQQVISAPEQVNFEFTKEGRERFEKLADSGKFNLSDEPCVLGSPALGAKAVSLDQIREAKSIYFQRYADAWIKFLQQTNVRGYRDVADAVEKLNVLSGSASPLLRLMKFVGENTYFPSVKAESSDGVVGTAVKKFGFENLKKRGEKAVAEASALSKPEFDVDAISRLFQPVRMAVQPDSASLVTEKNKGYVEALRKLQEAIEKYKEAPTAERITLTSPLQEAHLQAKAAERSLADSFDQNTQGVDRRVSEILIQPIDNYKPPRPIDPLDPTKRNADLAKMCGEIRPLLTKYPFNRQVGAAEANLTDLSRVFAPVNGRIWVYATDSMGDLLVKGAVKWEQKPDAPKPPVNPELLAFLSWAQSVTNVFFASGSQQPGFRYSIRPLMGQTVKVKFVIDGLTLNSKESPLQKSFEWPATGGGEPGAKGIVLGADTEYGFGDYPGTWGAFQLFQNADDRPLNEKTVTWSRTTGMGGAKPQPMTPAVKVQFVEFPNGIDVFNPHFLAPLRCPAPAIAPQ